MTDLDTRIREAVAEVAAAQEPSCSAAEVLRRLEAQPPATRRRFGARAVSIAAVVLLVLVVAAVVLVRGVPGRDDAPVHVGPGPATTEPPATVTPSTVAVAPAPSVPAGVIPAGWHDWGAPPELATAFAVQVVPVGGQVVLLGSQPFSTQNSDQFRQAADALDLTSGAWRALPDPMLPTGDPSNLPGGAAIGDRAAFWQGDGISILDPVTDGWTTGSPAPHDVVGPAVWTGSELVFVGDGLRYRPGTDEWTAMADPPAGTRWSATWDGNEVIAASLVSEQIPRGSQAFAYDAVGDHWRRLADPPLDGQALDLTWDGRRIVGVDYVLHAATYDPVTDAWAPLPDVPVRSGECGAAVRPLGNSVLAQVCGGDVVLQPDETWLVVTDGQHYSDLHPIGSAVATWGTLGGGQPGSAGGTEVGALWTYGP